MSISLTNSSLTVARLTINTTGSLTAGQGGALACDGVAATRSIGYDAEL